jgi:uncharacterized protein
MIRTRYIDSLRGMAILFMILAHTIPNDPLALEEVNFIIRLISSLAAPLFLFLVGFNYRPKETLDSSSIKKITLTFSFAVLIDVFLWQIIPFYSYDILYLIGFSLIILHFMKFESKLANFATLSALLIGALIYQYLHLYPQEVNEPSLSDYKDISLIDMFFNLFFNGWFPVFPWMIFPVLGYLYKRYKLNINELSLFFICIPIFLGLVYLEYLAPSVKRIFSLELFYPADLLYLGYSIAFLFIAVFSFKIIPWRELDFLQLLGRPSLFMYVFHLFFIHLTFSVLNEFFHSNILLVYLCYLIFFVTTAYLIHRLKNSKFYPRNSIILGVLMGK